MTIKNQYSHNQASLIIRSVSTPLRLSIVYSPLPLSLSFSPFLISPSVTPFLPFSYTEKGEERDLSLSQTQCTDSIRRSVADRSKINLIVSLQRDQWDLSFLCSLSSLISHQRTLITTREITIHLLRERENEDRGRINERMEGNYEMRG